MTPPGEGENGAPNGWGGCPTWYSGGRDRGLQGHCLTALRPLTKLNHEAGARAHGGSARGACSRHQPAKAAGDTAPGMLITQERIAVSGAKTAWDTLRLTVPNIQMRESRGNAVRIQRRGCASIYLEDQVRVLLDGVRWPARTRSRWTSARRQRPCCLRGD